MDFKRALSDRGVTPNSTWIREDNREMLIVAPDEDSATRELLTEFENVLGSDPSQVAWIRVVRVPVEGKIYACSDVMFVPLLIGQIDRGILKRIG